MQARILGLGVIVLALVGILPTTAQGNGPIVSLVDRNSTLTIDLASDAGLKDWVVDGVDQLRQQWFWYRIGPTGPESSIDKLGLVGSKASDNDWDDGNEHLGALYGNPNGLTVELAFTLSGGSPGSLQSDIAETLTIANHGSTALDFHFFQYCDLDLGDTSYDISAVILGGNTARQVSENVWASETVLTPPPSHREVSYFDDLLSRLRDGGPTTLSDQVGPLPRGPGVGLPVGRPARARTDAHHQQG